MHASWCGYYRILMYITKYTKQIWKYTTIPYYFPLLLFPPSSALLSKLLYRLFHYWFIYYYWYFKLLAPFIPLLPEVIWTCSHSFSTQTQPSSCVHHRLHPCRNSDSIPLPGSSKASKQIRLLRTYDQDVYIKKIYKTRETVFVPGISHV